MRSFDGPTRACTVHLQFLTVSTAHELISTLQLRYGCAAIVKSPRLSSEKALTYNSLNSLLPLSPLLALQSMSSSQSSSLRKPVGPPSESSSEDEGSPAIQQPSTVGKGSDLRDPLRGLRRVNTLVGLLGAGALSIGCSSQRSPTPSFSLPLTLSKQIDSLSRHCALRDRSASIE